MIAMLLMAQLSAAVAADPSAVRVLSADGVPVSVELVAAQPAKVPLAVRPPPATERMPNLYKVPPQCQNVPYRVVDRYGRPVAIRLGDLPNAGALQLLVDRKIDGCRVITVVKGGPVARDQPNPPAESYQVRPLETSAGKAETAPKREDAPSNRR